MESENLSFSEELATHCVENLSWIHVRLIMRLETPAERNYYLKETSNCFASKD